MRYTSWRLTRGFDESAPDVRVFVRYFDPSLRTHLDESLGLRKGLIGVANVYARVDQRGANQVIILHEIMHTLGATDKYVPGSGQPMYPEGFAEPDRQPLYPQRYAEIMAGRIAVTENAANIPRSLKLVRFGSKTIAEIGLGNEP